MSLGRARRIKRNQLRRTGRIFQKAGLSKSGFWFEQECGGNILTKTGLEQQTEIALFLRGCGARSNRVIGPRRDPQRVIAVDASGSPGRLIAGILEVLGRRMRLAPRNA